LEKIYCDQAAVNKIAADAFMAANPKVLVVYDSHDLKDWWNALSSAWQEVISTAAKISRDPLKEELARVDNVDSLNLSGVTSITDLEPLRKFMKLRVVIANKTSIQDLSPIREHRAIEYFDVSDTRINDLSSVSQFTKLKVLKADRCKIEGISPLQNMTGLEKLYVDETNVNDINAGEFLQSNPKCLLIYKTVHLNRWWKNLSKDWKDVITPLVKDTTRESFHKLVEQETFHFKDTPVSDLSGLSQFIRLTELYFSGTSIEEIVPLENLRSLTSLHASHGPIQIGESLSQLTELEDLDISDTPIEDLQVIAKLQKLKSLNCSGTQVKRLDAIEKLESLEFLDCSNTNVNKLSSLDHLHLKTLKCYNTKVSNKKIENFKASHPSCKVMYYR
jgi:Leucine-rich repeat (LRR) protein